MCPGRLGAHRGAFLQIWEGLVEIRVQFGEGNVQSFGRHLNSGLSSQIKLGATNGKANNMGRYWTMMLASIVFEEKTFLSQIVYHIRQELHAS